jgi:putative spermidine/putrescine transport system permease protein
LLVLPTVLFVLGLFVYPFLYDTIGTLLIAVPVTLVNVAAAIQVAPRVRLMRRQRLLSAILVVPITLGTVLVAEGLLTCLGPRAWVNRVLLDLGLAEHPIRFLHNYWGVFLSLLITGFPFRGDCRLGGARRPDRRAVGLCDGAA